MSDIILITIAIISLVYVAFVELNIKRGRIERVDTYSYRAVIKGSIKYLCMGIIFSILVYLFSKSLDVTISLGVFFLFCIIGGCLFGLFLEYQTKRRGGRKVD